MAIGENANENALASGEKWRLPIRYLMAILGSVGLAIIYGFKVNVSVAIVAMVNKSALHHENHRENQSLSNDVCNFDDVTETRSEDGPFVWSESLQGYILSAYFWGYMASLIPGGRMAELLSAKWVMNGSVLLNVVASILSPVAAEMHYGVFMFMRFLQGIGGGVTFPAMHVMVSKWAPPNERSVLVSIVYAGTALGTVISILLSGLLAAKLGWVWIFYIEGGLCLIWCTAWWLMIEDSPKQQQRFITQQEKNYILDSLGQKKNNLHAEKPKLSVPWRSIFTSPAFLAILVAHFCSNFGWYMLLIELPTFMNQILRFNMSSNAGLSSLPFLCMWLFTMILSKVLSILQDKRVISVTLSRKLATWIAAGVPAICLIGVSFVGCNRSLAVAFMTIGVTCIGGMYCGFLANHIDIAPNFAGTLVAITNCIATIPGFLVPIFVGKLTEGNQTIEAWRIIFLSTVVLYAVLIVVYTIFGSGEEQPWNRVQSKEDEETPTDQNVPLKESN
ncbi:putative inorganic phosphate cotransporter [Venturia canescens]|uniref:putative inorganic phosphate cotransporter n=1 Tax=Venturia canescens TaxID=32260 RepID=UPI001C9CDBAB|nr:putative inorganic phosphate cotransporter [Venturia canescens]